MGNRARLAGLGGGGGGQDQGTGIRYNLNKVQSGYMRLCIQPDRYKYAMETCERAYTQSHMH
jgi:hypothetical protein